MISVSHWLRPVSRAFFSDVRVRHQDRAVAVAVDEPSASDNEQGYQDILAGTSHCDAQYTKERASSHAAAAAGPSSKAAASSKGSKKRAASVAFKDAASLLPANLDEEMLSRTLKQLQPRNRMQKQALLQSYKEHFSHWRFLLR